VRNRWLQFIRGWWGYYRLAEERKPIFKLEGWIRTHIRKCFWLRWHNADGRERALRRLGVKGPMLKIARSGRGAWRMAHSSVMRTGLKNAVLRRYKFLMPSDLAAASC
jgi:RNA-directed DNA polymerase